MYDHIKQRKAGHTYNLKMELRNVFHFCLTNLIET